MVDQKILALIPARGGSKRIPDKNIKALCGKPLISYSIISAKKSKNIDKVIVSTDDENIADISREFTAEVIKRPKELAKDNTPTIEVVYHALDSLKKENYDPSIIVLLQPTSPLRNTEDIDNAIDLFLNSNCESVVSVCEIKHIPYWSLNINKGYLKPLFGKKYLKIKSQDFKKAYRPNGVLYISTPRSIHKYRSFFCKYTIPYVMPIERSIDIDDEFDFLLAEFFMKLLT